MSVALHVDVLVVGGGIAGTALAATLPAGVRVLLIEKDDQLGYHSTGRSAANYSELLASAPTLQLTRLGRQIYDHPPAGLESSAILRPLPTLVVAAQPEVGRLEELFAGARERLPIRLLDAAQIAAAVPFLRPDHARAGILDPTSAAIDVNVLHTAWARMVESRPYGKILRRVELLSAEPGAHGWTAQTSAGAVNATTIVNAAGAWADDVARRCQVAPLKVTPLRRTVVIVPVENEFDLSSLPMVADLGGGFYFKRDGRRLLMSAADENEDVPGDSQPDELDIAIAMDRLENVTSLVGYRPAARWSGLRNFAPDREMVIGADARMPGFFWLAGQGGTGIQTSAGAARLAAALLYPRECPLPADRAVDPSLFSARRFEVPVCSR